MPKVVDHAQRRQELTRHVWTLIRQQGLDGVTIRNLTEVSGWSSGAIRHYLPHRDSILTFAAEQVAVQAEGRLRAVDTSGAPLDALERFLLALLPLDEDTQMLMEVWLAFAAAAVRRENYADTHGILYRDLHQIIQGILKNFADQGWQSTQAPEVAANTIHALIDGLALHLLLRQVTPEQARTTVHETLTTLLQQPTPEVKTTSKDA